MFNLTQKQMAKLYRNDTIFIFNYKSLYGIGYSQAQRQFYITKNFDMQKPITKKNEYKAMTAEETKNILIFKENK